MMHSHNNHNNRLLPTPQRTQRAFHVNPSPHEIAVGSVEQWRRSKLSKAWKTVLISLVKHNTAGSGGVVLCVWRDNISVDGTSNVLEVIQQIKMADVDSVNLHDRDSFSLSLLTTNLEESQVVTFRCLDEPDATKDWVTTLRTVYSHISEKKQQQNAAASRGYPVPPPAEVDLLSFDSPPLPVQQSWEQQLMRQPQQQQQQQQPHQQYPQYMQQRQHYPQQQQQQYARQQPKGQVPAHFYPQARHQAQQNTAYNNNGTSSNDWAKAFVQNPPQQQQRYPNQPPLYNNRAVTPPPRTAPPSVPRPANGRQQSNQSHPQQQRKPQPMPPHSTPQRSFSAPLTTQTTAQRHDQIKKRILVEWALAPPALQQLRPLSQLIRTIHIVMPPRFTAVANHSYFYKWTPPPATTAGGGVNQQSSQEDAKILRKLKFFLHPDKLPKQNGGKNDSFSEDQAFLCKLLWDIIQDATAVADGK